MAEQLIDELKADLKEKVTSEIEKVRDAVENRELPPLPISPIEVAEDVKEIIKNHEVTAEEMTAAAASRGLSVEEMQIADQLRKNEK